MASTGERVADCAFCEPDKRNLLYNDATRWPVADGAHIWPALGMLPIGNMLAVTDKHETSLAAIGRAGLQAINEGLRPYEAYLSETYAGCIRIEHGSDGAAEGATGRGSGACIAHAHLQLFPVGGEVGGKLQAGLSVQAGKPWQRLSNYEDLAGFQGQPYLYLGRPDPNGGHRHYVIPDPQLPGQAARQCIARAIHIENPDWAVPDPARDTLARAAIEAFSQAFPPYNVRGLAAS